MFLIISITVLIVTSLTPEEWKKVFDEVKE
nr:MAG TPA: hypothetical protein [Caudoviricetes sp.]